MWQIVYLSKLLIQLSQYCEDTPIMELILEALQEYAQSPLTIQVLYQITDVELLDALHNLLTIAKDKDKLANEAELATTLPHIERE